MKHKRVTTPLSHMSNLQWQATARGVPMHPYILSEYARGVQYDRQRAARTHSLVRAHRAAKRAERQPKPVGLTLMGFAPPPRNTRMAS
jgi:hypothetical protein